MTTASDAQALIAKWEHGNVLAADCPSRPVLQHLTSRWGTLVMLALTTGPHRFSALRRRVAGISERMLAQTLQELEADGFVLRVALPVVPPHVEYSLTPLGAEAADHVVALVRFVEQHLPRILAPRAAA
ncbi:winged helix-turn-helix transcriptional regulator [Neotabrizicola sp. sgz301269]|uniref:winged helix-turn-helix transcriptional regulator n=1 Tax=Neotabrizicola sp. sgz301269 TaxID=3276282 RepID=UPI0037702AE3